MFKKILVPLDGSEVAEKILEEVKKMATLTKAEIDLLRVARATGVFPGTDPTDKEVEVVKRAEQYLDYVKEKLTKEGFCVSSHVRYGQPAAEILDHSERVDLVAMSTHGRTGLDRWALGSVAEKVVRHSKTPVLLIRAV